MSTNPDLRQWNELMDYFTNKAKVASRELMIPADGNFMGRYIYASVILYETMTHQEMHQESEKRRSIEHANKMGIPHGT